MIKTAAPLPFNLVRLQQYMNKVQTDGKKTLDITQQLRENIKAITYKPLSDCSYLSDEQFSEAPELSMPQVSLSSVAGY